jgi:carbon-monoxide dehydrogenase small subunit
MIISAKALLDETSVPERDDIKEALSGNLCRCSGYQKIVQAVASASQSMKKGE